MKACFSSTCCSHLKGRLKLLAGQRLAVRARFEAGGLAEGPRDALVGYTLLIRHVLVWVHLQVQGSQAEILAIVRRHCWLLDVTLRQQSMPGTQGATMCCCLCVRFCAEPCLAAMLLIEGS